MKLIIIAIILQILFTLIMDFLYVKFDVLKWQSYDDVIYWLLMIMITAPVYFKGYLTLYKKEMAGGHFSHYFFYNIWTIVGNFGVVFSYRSFKCSFIKFIKNSNKIGVVNLHFY